jgi:hypothetical protein
MEKLLLILLVPFLFACGSGGGGSDTASTVDGTTPLVEGDTSTQTGTYAIRSMRITYSTGQVVDSSSFDKFESYLTLDYSSNKLTMLLSWEDEELGDFYNYDESSLNDSSSATVGDIYVTQTGDYDITIFYNNLCDTNYCADMLLRIRKTSDTVENLLQRPANRNEGVSSNEKFINDILSYAVPK